MNTLYHQTPSTGVNNPFTSLAGFQDATALKRGRGVTIDAGLWDEAIDWVSDVEWLPGGDPTTPIADRLGWKQTRFGRSSQPTRWAGFFRQGGGQFVDDHLAGLAPDQGDRWYQAFLSWEIRDRDDRVIKYHSPKGNNDPYLPPITHEVAAAIADRHRLDYTPPIADFWGWVSRCKDLPLILCESAWAALALLSRGHIAVATRGCWGAVASAHKGGKLHPAIRALLAGRSCTKIAYDCDSKPSAKLAVSRAIAVLSRACKKEFKKPPTLYRVVWDEGGGCKGIDDLCLGAGGDVVDKVIAFAPTIDQAIARSIMGSRLTRTPDAYLHLGDGEDDLSSPAIQQRIREMSCDRRVVAIQSPKGTGKSKLISRITAGSPMLSVSPRISLAKSQLLPFGAAYRTDIDTDIDGVAIKGRWYQIFGKSPRYTTCIDGGIFSFGDPRIFQGGWLILDEWEQLARHVANGATLGKNQGRAIDWLKDFGRELKVYAASADLNDWALDYLEKVTGERPFLIQVRKQRPQWNARVRIGGSALPTMQELLELARSGKRLYINCDSKKKVKVLDYLMQAEGINSLAIHADSSGGEVESSVLKDPRKIADYDIQVLISSPSIGSGYSIEYEYFDYVAGLYEGAILPEDASQALARVRGNIPRIIWCKKVGLGNSKSSPAIAPDQWMDDEIARARAAAKQSDMEDDFEALGTFQKSELLRLKADVACERNLQRWSWGECLIALLESEGKVIDRVVSESSKEFRETVKAARETIDRIEAQAIRSAANWDFEQVQEIQNKDNKTNEERAAISKFWMQDFYVVDLDGLTEEKAVDLVIQDCQGKRRSRLRQLENYMDEFLAEECDFLQNEKLLESGETPNPRDIGSGLLQLFARKKLGLDWFLKDGQKWNKKSDQVRQTANIARQSQDQVRLILGTEIWGGMSDVAIVNALLRGMDIEVLRSRQGAGDRLWEYQIDQHRYTESRQICQRRIDRRIRQIEIESIADLEEDQVWHDLDRWAKKIGHRRALEILKSRFGVAHPRECDYPKDLLRELILAAA